jgi:hypothetical protein
MAVVKSVFEIDDTLRSRFKARVAIEGTTIKDVLAKLIEGYLEHSIKGGEVAAKAELREVELFRVLYDMGEGGRTLKWFCENRAVVEELLRRGWIKQLAPRLFGPATAGKDALKKWRGGGA